MSDSTIGIKVADGSYYPVLEHGFTGTKKLTLTTSQDNQQKVKIDLYRGVSPSPTPARFIGSLVIENIPRASQGKPEIELLIGIDDEGQLSAEACTPGLSPGEQEAITPRLDHQFLGAKLVESHFGEDFSRGGARTHEDGTPGELVARGHHGELGPGDLLQRQREFIRSVFLRGGGVGVMDDDAFRLAVARESHSGQ